MQTWRPLLMAAALSSVALAVCPVAWGATITVGASGANYTKIQDAINAAKNKDVIVVNPGLYTEDLNFNGKSVVLRSAGGASVTTIRGTSIALSLRNGETVDAVIQGFTVTSGGYGMYVSSAAPKIIDTIFANSTGSYTVYATGSSQPQFVNSQFSGNKTSYTIYADTTSTVSLTGCTFNGNTAVHGGALYLTSGSTGVISSSSFGSNKATSGYGGAIYATGSSSLLVESSTFTGNKGTHGGAMFIETSANRTMVRGSKFYGNGATYGGAFFIQTAYQVYISDNWMVENTATSQGGGVYISSNAHSALINNTIVGSDAPTGGGIFAYDGSGTLLTQNIIAGSTNGQGVYTNGASARFLAWYNDVYDNFKGSYGGNIANQTGLRGNISADPKFTEYSNDGNFANDDFTLLSGSPCINAGSTTFKDADGTTADLGAGGGQEDSFATGALIVSPVGASSYRTINAALTASRNNETVLVYPGVYYEDVNFNGKAANVKSAFGPETVVISAPSMGVNFSKGETAASILDGVTIWSAGGYGVYILNSSPLIKNSHIRFCYSSYGAYTEGGQPTLTSVRFEGNAPSYTYYITASAKVSMSGMSFVSNSSANGGAVHVASPASATIASSYFEANKATSSYGGAIYSNGTLLYVRDSRFVKNSATHGGGIFTDTSQQRLLVRDSQFHGNTSTYGGGVFVNGAQQGTILDSEFVENMASSYGGGVYLSTSSQTALINNTLVGNGATQGGHVYLYSATNALLLQNILAESYSGEAIYAYDTAARWVAWYNDFYSNFKGDFGGAAKDCLGVRGNVAVDPLFEEYSQDGNFTNDDLTLNAASEAIDAGDPQFLDVDGSAADLGQGGGDDERVVPGATLTVSPLEGAQYNRLQPAIAASTSGAILYVYPGLYYGDIDFGGKDITIKAVYGPETAVIAGTSAAVSAKATETAKAILEGMTVWSQSSYGIYTSGASPTFKNVHIRYCYSSYGGYHSGGAPSYVDATFEDNAPSYTLYFDSGAKGSVTGTMFRSNKSAHGGGIYFASGSKGTVTSSTFDSNQAVGSNAYGGAIYIYNASVLIKGSSFLKNQAIHGGAIWSQPYTVSNLVTVRDSTFFANKATYGGAVFNSNSHTYLIDCNLVENEATQGGAAYVTAGAQSTFLNDTMVGNRGAYGGGIYAYSSSNTLVANTIISSSADGHGIYSTDASARILVSYTDVYGNADGEYGGNITDQSKDHGNLNVDPGFVAYSRNGNMSDDNLTLKSTSSVKDKGIPAFPDKDGSVSDLGTGGGDDEKRASGYDYVVSPLFDSPYTLLSQAVAASGQAKKIAIYPGLYYSDTDLSSKTVYLTGVYGQLGTVLVGSSTTLNVDQGEGSSTTPVSVTGLSLWSEGGYAVYEVSSYLALVDSAVRFCRSSYGVYAQGGSLDLTRVVLEQNAPSYTAYYSAKAKGKITGSTFLSNSSANGGGLHVTGGADVAVSDSRFAYNKATSSYGGGIYVTASLLSVKNTVFQNNSATHGGGIFGDSGNAITLSGNFFVANTASYGGGYFGQYGKSTAANNIFQGNTAVYNGGGLYVGASQSDSFTNNDFLENAASSKGGGVYCYSGALYTSVNNIYAITENGEGLYIEASVYSDIRYNDFYRNFDGDLAGAVTSLDSTNLKVDPKFVSFTDDDNYYNDDLHLATGSPLINAGDPVFTDASDGSRSDIGAYGGSGSPVLDRDGDGYTTVAGDCDDSSVTTYPGAVEIKDNKDNDCNGVVDDPFSDKDGDGYDPTNGDCNDANASINPGAAEKCDGIDQNCDGQIDEGAQATWYVDADGDGYGSADFTVKACAQPSGYTSNAGDCNDGDASVKPSAAEACDGKDNNCNGKVDENLATTYYKDADADGYGDSSLTQQACSKPAGTSVVGGDCDETDPKVNPGASESCNGKDDNCNGQIDEGTATTWYLDADSDGFGDGNQTKAACSQPTNYVKDAGDCNDLSASIYPGAKEVCDKVDNDCDGAVDEGLANTYYKDADGDGYGLAGSTEVACSTPTGYSSQSGDCDDTRGDIKPGATEVCDNLDNDCDGVTDENLTRIYYLDVDGDSYGDTAQSKWLCSAETGYVTAGGDCDDRSASVYPGADEKCNNTDDDCDGSVDDGLSQVTYYRDLDGDGYGVASDTKTTCSGAPAGYAAKVGDCDDNLKAVNPGATETCNGIDDDCDKQSDEGFDADLDGVPTCALGSVPSDCNDSDKDIYPGNTESCDGKDNNCDGTVDEVQDKDGDGFTGCGAKPDCDDNNPAAFPGGKEVCDQVDNDCDDVIDEGFDMDGDTYFTCAHGELPADCNDGNPAISPAATETCDGVDNDCDGQKDEGLLKRFCADDDGDGYGDPTQATQACTTPEGSTLNCTDFNDDDASSFPGAPEAPDGVDNDNDGQVDEGTDYADDDGDGYNEAEGMDCNDSNPYVYPGAPEFEDNLDNDCDGQVDEDIPTGDGDGDGYTPGQGDCDDTDPTVHPKAEEVVDGVDNDCNGLIDDDTTVSDDDGDGYSELEGDCDDTEVYTYPGATEYADSDDNDCDGQVDESLDTVDDDGDGYSEADGDVDDNNPSTYPDAPEVQDGVDNDGDGIIDEGTAAYDDDGDHYTEEQGDCNDKNPYVNPGKTEVLGNGVDDNCNGQVDESPEGAPQPDLQVGETLVDVGKVYVDQLANGAVHLTNAGNAALTIQGLSLLPEPGDFTLLSGAGVLVPPGGSYTLWFQFSPTSVGVKTVTLEILTDDPDQPSATVTLQGEGLEVLNPGDDDDTTPPGDDDDTTPPGDDDDTTAPGDDDTTPPGDDDDTTPPGDDDATTPGDDDDTTAPDITPTALPDGDDDTTPPVDDPNGGGCACDASSSRSLPSGSLIFGLGLAFFLVRRRRQV